MKILRYVWRIQLTILNGEVAFMKAERDTELEKILELAPADQGEVSQKELSRRAAQLAILEEKVSSYAGVWWSVLMGWYTAS